MITRAQLLTRGALAACAAGGAGAVAPWLTRAVAQNDAGQVELLDVALVLERLEAELYERARREVPDLGRSLQRFARSFGGHEREHEKGLVALIGNLGGVPGRPPRFRLERALRSRAAFLDAMRVLEDTGVGAYNAAGPLVKEPDVLALAGSIVQVEARHAATIRELAGDDPAPSAFDRPVPADAALRRRLRPFLA